MFLKRSFQKELMDDFSINDKRIEKAYQELHLINKLLGGNSVSKTGINYFRDSSKTGLKILDVGAGASDILYDIKKNYKDLCISSMDLSRYACNYQKLKSGNNNIICADALNFPIKTDSYDIIHSSLFLHHLNENEIVLVMNNFIAAAKKGIIINDLRRNILAYAGIRLLTSILSNSEFVKNDGPLSVKKAFTIKDLKNILMKAGIKDYVIKRKWAFRFLIIIPSVKNDFI